MKKIEKKRIEFDYTYRAVDGTEFSNEAECLAYEASAFGVLRGRLAKIALRQDSEYEIFTTGNEDNTAFVVAPKDEAEVQVVQQLLYMRHCGNDESKAMAADAVQVGKPIAVLFDYDNDYCWIEDLAELISNATAGKFKVVAAE